MTAENGSADDPGAELFGAVSRNWGWMLALGIVYLILGVVGLYMTVALTVASVFVFGVILLVGGVAQLVEAFTCKGWKSMVWHILIALLYVLAGIYIMQSPAAAAVTLTFVLAAMLLANGVLRLITAFQHGRAGGGIWVGLGGVASVLLGLMIIAKWPISGLFAIGLFVAVELIVAGWSAIAVALAARAARDAGPGGTDAAAA